MEHGLGKRDPLAVAAGEAADDSVAHVLQGEALAGDGKSFPQLFSFKAAQTSHEREELVDTHVAIQRGVFRHVADASARGAAVAHDVEACHLCAPRARAQIARQHAKDGRLSRAVWSQEPENLALAEFERDLIDRKERAISLGQAVKRDHRHRRAPGSLRV